MIGTLFLFFIKLIEANPKDLVILIFFIFLFEIPPKAIIGKVVSLHNKLNFMISKDLFFFIDVE